MILDIFKENFKTTTFVFVVGEKNKRGVLHFHLLLGIRNFIDYDYCLKNNISNILKIKMDSTSLYLTDYDIKVQPLRKFRDIKN
jgi:hypothetical protein